MPTNVAEAGPEAQVVERAIALEYDCLAAYSEAAELAEEPSLVRTLQQFAADCKKHIAMWQDRLKRMTSHEGTPNMITEPLNRGKVMVGSLLGDKAIMVAIKNNAADTCTAYEQVASRVELALETKEISQAMLKDARRHRTWMEAYLAG
jgi:rubrerythrin